MLSAILLFLSCIVGTYFTGTAINISYRLMRVAELRVDYDNTRNKETKNECTNLARHHMRGIKDAWKWPSIVVASIIDAIKWGSSLDSK